MKKQKLFYIIIRVAIAFSMVVTLPGFVRYFYQAGAGHSFLEIMESKNLSWDTMTQEDRKPYIKIASLAGWKSAIFMMLGQYLPIYSFIIIILGLLNPSITNEFRKNLLYAFWIVWVFGMFFLAIGSGYWGQALKVPESIVPAFIIYSFVAILSWIIFVVLRKVQKFVISEAKEGK
ncbi:hypothetical protein ACFL49_00600 [Candidatus Omnitrophota bacterium]